MDLWERLAMEGKLELIDKLHKAEMRVSGFGTIVVPDEGFSQNDDTHNMVLDWMNKKHINVLNPGLEKARLEYALKGRL